MTPLEASASVRITGTSPLEAVNVTAPDPAMLTVRVLVSTVVMTWPLLRSVDFTSPLATW
jgi:hypothetical protein